MQGGTLAPAGVTKTLTLQMKSPTGAPILLGLHLYARAPPVNRPPSANAGPDQTAPVGRTVTLDGSGSTDPEGHLLQFDWSFLSRPAGQYRRPLRLDRGLPQPSPSTASATTRSNSPSTTAPPTARRTACGSPPSTARPSPTPAPTRPPGWARSSPSTAAAPATATASRSATAGRSSPRPQGAPPRSPARSRSRAPSPSTAPAPTACN